MRLTAVQRLSELQACWSLFFPSSVFPCLPLSLSLLVSVILCVCVHACVCGLIPDLGGNHVTKTMLLPCIKLKVCSQHFNEYVDLLSGLCL